MKIAGIQIPTLTFVAAVGIVGALIFTFTLGNPKAPEPNQLNLPPSTPYAQAVSGTGLVEAGSRNIAVGAFLSGIVTEIRVTEGESVKQGDILFVVDKRSAEAEVAVKEKDVASAEALLNVGKATFEDEDAQLKRLMSLQAGQAVSVEQQQRQLFATRRARAQLDQAIASLDSAKASLGYAKVTLEKHSVRAPVDGEILKIQTRAGEYVNANQGNVAPILMGSVAPLHLRVLIDENDLWRFNQKAEATAFLRSNKERQYSLTFVRIEPYVQPKKDLSGDTREQVDTRVMEVIYAITPVENAPLYVGQQLDVFINAEVKEE
ncbi:MAG: efflux RND transporter periplasmic adaptor subunit [Rickettsiales bacterium]|nr:efflux RND transporter periplasmic adaptor subunit [Rickettsiales bacterium]